MGLETMLESDNKVIGIAYDDYVTTSMLVPPVLNPEVKYVVKINVG